MDTGTGIFLGAVFVGLVILFVATKDRWKWKRIVLWAVALALVPGIAVVGWLFYEVNLSNHEYQRSKVQTEFWGLRIGMTAADVRFRKGKPTTEKDGIWVYRGAENKNYVDHFYVAAFGRDDKIRYVLAVATGDPESNLPQLQGITASSTLDDIEKKFGTPDHVSISSDELRRMLSYKQFNVCFRLEKNLVTALGLCDGAQEPLRFIEEQPSSTQEGSNK